MPQQALTCGCESIRVEESADFGIIVSALEVVKAAFGVEDIAAVAQGVMLAQGGGQSAGAVVAGGMAAPGIVGIGYHRCAGTVQNGGNIALQVGGVVVNRAVVGKGLGRTLGIIGKADGMAHRAGGSVGNFHLQQLGAAVDIAVGSVGVVSLYTQTVGIVDEVENILRFVAVLFVRGKLPPVLPGVGIGVMIPGGVAYGVVSNALAVIGRKQIAPGAVAIGILGNRRCVPQLPGSIGVGGFAQDVACVVIDPCGSLIRRRVILPDQLVGRIVNIRCRIRAVRDREDVAVIIVGIGVGNIVEGALGAIRSYLGGKLTIRRGGIGIGFRQDGCAAAGCYLLGDPAVGIVGIGFGNAVGGDPRYAVIQVVGVRGSMGYTVDGFYYLGQVVDGVVLVADAVAVVFAFFRDPHHAVGKVIVVSCRDAGLAIVDRSQRAGIIVSIGYIGTILIGLLCNPALVVAQGRLISLFFETISTVKENFCSFSRPRLCSAAYCV